jgi:hypothetical protein
MTSNRPQTLRPDQARCLGLSGNDRFWRIPLKSRKSSATTILRRSIVKSLCRYAASQHHYEGSWSRLCKSICPSRCRVWNASAVLKNLVRRPKRFFSTLSARSGQSLVRRSITFEICTRNVAPLLANHELAKASPRPYQLSSIELKMRAISNSCTRAPSKRTRSQIGSG